MNINHYNPPQSNPQPLKVVLVNQIISIYQTVYIYSKNLVTHLTNAQDGL